MKFLSQQYVYASTTLLSVEVKNVSLLIGISGCNNECLLTIFKISFMFSSEYYALWDTLIKLNCVLASFALRVVY